MSLNAVTLSGNLGADAELRYTQGSGMAVMTCSLGVGHRTRQQDGSYKDVTQWITCVMFGKRAEAVAPWLRKGNKVSITGHLQKRTWEKDGEQRSIVEVVIDELDMMSYKRDAQQSVPQASAPVPPVAAPPAAQDLADDDIPF